MKFNPALIARVRRLDRALAHHDATLRTLRESGSVLECEAFTLLMNRVRRLQTETASVHADRRALADALVRLGVNLDDTDATVGRSLRRAIGHRRQPPARKRA